MYNDEQNNNYLEFEKKVIGTIEITKQVTEENINSIICTAFESDSINYWVEYVETDTEHWKDRPKGEYLSSWATKIILEEKEILLKEEGEEELLSLTLKKLLKGIKLNIVNRPFDCDLEDMDATTVDCIIQYALFGEVVYS